MPKLHSFPLLALGSLIIGLTRTSLAPAQQTDSPASAEKPTLSEAAPTKSTPPIEKTPKKKQLDCSKGFLNLRTPPKECADERQLEYAILPAVFTTKETSFGAAIYGELTYFTNKDPETGVSRTGLGLTLTARKQFIARAPVVVTFDKDNFIIDGTIDFRIYPNRYYGLGNEADWDYQQYREDALSFNFEFRRRLFGDVYLGLLWDLRNVFAVKDGAGYDTHGDELAAGEEGLLTEEAPLGNKPYFDQGFGAQLVFDSRDNFAYPLSGDFHRLSVRYFDPAFGAAHTFTLVTLDARKYFSLPYQQVIAVQLLSEIRDGTPPFSLMSELGGTSLLRGYFKGRYRDNNMLLLQAEYRFPIYKRLSGVAFGDVGQVYGPSGPFAANAFRWTVGVGGRFRFGARTYMRIDLAGNHETGAVVFNGGQAF